MDDALLFLVLCNMPAVNNNTGIWLTAEVENCGKKWEEVGLNPMQTWCQSWGGSRRKYNLTVHVMVIFVHLSIPLPTSYKLLIHTN